MFVSALPNNHVDLTAAYNHVLTIKVSMKPDNLLLWDAKSLAEDIYMLASGSNFPK